MKHFCLFQLFRYRFKTPKQAETNQNFLFLVSQNKPKQILFRFVLVRTQKLVCLFRGHPRSSTLSVLHWLEEKRRTGQVQKKPCSLDPVLFGAFSEIQVIRSGALSIESSPDPIFKGTVPRDSFPQVPDYTIRANSEFSKIHGNIRSSRCTTAVKDTGSKWKNL